MPLGPGGAGRWRGLTRRHGCGAAGAGELGPGGEAVMPAISPTKAAVRIGAAAAVGRQGGRGVGDQCGELASERVDRAGELADAAQLVACDAPPRARRRPEGAARAVAGGRAGPGCAARSRSRARDQDMRAKIVDQRGAIRPAARDDRAEADLELAPGQPGARERVDPVAYRTARRPVRRSGPICRARGPGRGARRPSAAARSGSPSRRARARAVQAARHVPAILQRPDPLILERTRPASARQALLARRAPCAAVGSARTHRLPPRCARPCADRSRSRHPDVPSIDLRRADLGRKTSVSAQPCSYQVTPSVLNRRSLTHRHQANPGFPGAAVTESESSDRRTDDPPTPGGQRSQPIKPLTEVTTTTALLIRVVAEDQARRHAHQGAPPDHGHGRNRAPILRLDYARAPPRRGRRPPRIPPVLEADAGRVDRRSVRGRVRRDPAAPLAHGQPRPVGRLGARARPAEVLILADLSGEVRSRSKGVPSTEAHISAAVEGNACRPRFGQCLEECPWRDAKVRLRLVPRGVPNGLSGPRPTVG